MSDMWADARAFQIAYLGRTWQDARTAHAARVEAACDEFRRGRDQMWTEFSDPGAALTAVTSLHAATVRQISTADADLKTKWGTYAQGVKSQGGEPESAPQPTNVDRLTEGVPA